MINKECYIHVDYHYNTSLEDILNFIIKNLMS